MPHYTVDEVEQRPEPTSLGPLFEQPEVDDLAALRGAAAIVNAQEGQPPVRLEPPSVPIDTSEDAALKVMDKTHHLRERIFAWLHGRGRHGATEYEIEVGLRMEGQGSTIRPRLWELEGNVPAGRSPRPPRIMKTAKKRDGMRVYVTLFHASRLASTQTCAD